MENFCPNCLSWRLKPWAELSPDEKFIFERQPASRDFPAAERKQHLFCPRCLYETKPFEEKA